MSDLRDDCTGYEFVLGEIFGLRWWRVDRYGRLNARTYPGIWSTGEQLAECKKGDQPYVPALFLRSYLSFTSSLIDPGYTQAPEAKTTAVTIEHSVPEETCSCGFYAFTDPDYDYHGQLGDACGVIRGYGRTLIGAHGFRCAKAQIVALCVPPPPLTISDVFFPGRTARRKVWQAQRDRLATNYDGIPIYTSRAKMLGAHPLTSTNPPSPESDPDFWTRP